jgi:hypothetical protein
MLVYAHWDNFGNRILQCFSTQEAASKFIIKQINMLLGNDFYEVQPELYRITKEKMDLASKQNILSLDQMQDLVNSYNTYSKLVLKTQLPIHNISEVAVVE